MRYITNLNISNHKPSGVGLIKRFSQALQSFRAETLCILTGLLFLSTSNTYANANEFIYSAIYKGKYSGWNITMERNLKKTGENEYALVSHYDNFFASITETSNFSLDGELMQPNNYKIKRSIFGKKKTESLDYDWQKKQAIFKRSNKKRDTTYHTLSIGDLDPALYQLQIQSDLFTQSKTEPELKYTFAKRKKKNTYDFDIIGEDKLIISGKSYDAIVLERVDTRNKKTSIWVLPEMDFQIGKLKQQNGKKSHEIILTDYQANIKNLYDFYQRTPAKNAKEKPEIDSNIKNVDTTKTP